MSISFNHPKNTVTSTGSMNLIVSGGSTTAPQPIRFSSTSVIMPVRALPTGEAGAMVFDTGTKTMKYHDGTNWVELLPQDVVLAPIYNQLTTINQQLAGKVDTVSYITGSVAQASISGTQLNITFPNTSGGGSTGNNGLFTSSKQGTIQYYALTSGMNATTIREQMSGVSGGQSGRSGTQANPWVTNDGWCFSDGMWWTWLGDTGTVTQQVPNLNQAAYLKPMVVSGVTQTASIIASSGTIGSTALTIAQLPEHNFSVSGSTSVSGSHTHPFKSYSSNTALDGGTSNRRSVDVNTGLNTDGGLIGYAGDHIHTFSGTTNTIGSGQTHTHSLSNVDVTHFNVAVIYNIATPSYALNEEAANEKYVLKTGDVMTGALTIASNANVRGSDPNLTFAFRNATGGERAMIYHSSSSNTLRFRNAGGTEIFLNGSGLLTTPSLAVSGSTATVNGQNIVRTVNGQSANASGAVSVTVPTNTASLAQNGWWKDASTGMIYQWGRETSPPRDSGNAFYVAFPIQFPNACFNVQVTHGQNSNTEWSPNVATWAGAQTTAGVYIRAENHYFWFAIGN